MTEISMSVLDKVRKLLEDANGGGLREMVRVLAEALMNAEVDGLCRAGHGERCSATITRVHRVDSVRLLLWRLLLPRDNVTERLCSGKLDAEANEHGVTKRTGTDFGRSLSTGWLEGEGGDFERIRKGDWLSPEVCDAPSQSRLGGGT